MIIFVWFLDSAAVREGVGPARVTWWQGEGGGVQYSFMAGNTYRHRGELKTIESSLNREGFDRISSHQESWNFVNRKLEILHLTNKNNRVLEFF